MTLNKLNNVDGTFIIKDYMVPNAPAIIEVSLPKKYYIDRPALCKLFGAKYFMPACLQPY